MSKKNKKSKNLKNLPKEIKQVSEVIIFEFGKKFNKPRANEGNNQKMRPYFLDELLNP